MVKKITKKEVVEKVKSIKTSDKVEVTVHFQGKSRVFSLALHGNDFEKIAEGFASKYIGATVE